jgi:colicin import membrane protein
VSTLAYLGGRPDYAMRRAFVLAFAVHALLIAVMFFGVRMQNRPGDTVTVELWEAPPPPPPPAPVVEAPKPPPKVEPPQPKPEPKPEPEPEVKKPEIVEKAPPPKPKPKPKPEATPAPNQDLEKLLLREQVAMEQRKLDEEREARKRADDARRKAESEKTARALAETARNKALLEYVNRIRTKVRQNWNLPPDLQGNPQCVFKVVQLPTGEVLEATLVKSSGNAAYDEAVYRAIMKSSPLPLPASREQFYRELELTVRPRD